MLVRKSWQGNGRENGLRASAPSMASEASSEKTRARRALPDFSRLPQLESMLASYSQNMLTVFLLKDVNGLTL